MRMDEKKKFFNRFLRRDREENNKTKGVSLYLKMIFLFGINSYSRWCYIYYGQFK